MFVRTASERDVQAVLALLVETWHATYDDIYGSTKVTEISDDWHSVASLKAQLAKPYSEFLVADDGRTIGGMTFASTGADGKTIMLHQLYVRPSHQGQGIGGMLLDEVIDSFHDAERITLEVDEANASAIAFYRAQDFVEAGRTANCGNDQSGIPALVFERRLGERR